MYFDNYIEIYTYLLYTNTTSIFIHTQRRIMTNSPKPRLFNPVRILTVGMGFVLFTVVCFTLSQVAIAETVDVNGMNDSTNYENVDIVDTLGKAAYTHKGTITGTSSLTINAPATNSSYRQWLGGGNGSYTFTGPINVNAGQLLINTGTLQTKTINLNGGDMYVMYEDCLPHDAVINVGAGSMLDLESKANAIKGATINIASGGSFRLAGQNLNDSTEPVTLNIAGVGRLSSTYPDTYNSPGAIDAYGDSNDINLTANINLTDDATISVINVSTNRQFLIRGTLTGSSTATFSSDNYGRWIRLVAGAANTGLDMSGFSGNIVADNVKLRLYTDSLGTGSNITVQNSATAYFNNTTALNNYTGSFTVNNATIALEAAGKLNNLSGNGTVSIGDKALTLNNTTDTTFSGTITGTAAITKNGSGKLELSANNTYTGATNVSAGELIFSGSVLPVSAMKATGGSLVLGTAGNTITVKRGASITASGGAVRVDGDLVFESPGSGFVACDGSWTGSGSMTLDGGYIRVGTNFNTTTGINFNGGSILNNNNDAVLSSDVTITKDGSTMQAGWSKSLTLTGALKGNASLTVGSDSGWLRFSGDGSQYKGSLLVKGNMRVGKDGVDSSDCSKFLGAQVINLNGGTIQNNNNNITIPNDLNVMTETGFKTGWSKKITLTGNVTGSAKLKQVSDSGWLILKTHSDGDAFTGSFQTGWASTSSRGQTQLAAQQPLGANAGILYNYGYLDMNGYSQIFKGIVDDGANNKLGRVYNTTGTKSVLTLDITSQNLTYAGTFESNVELIVNASGAGTQTFTNGGSSFTGNATINGGKIRMTGKGSNGNSPIGKVSNTRYVYVNDGGELVFANQDVLANAHNYAPINFVVDGGKISNEGANYNFLQNSTFKNGGQLYASDGNATWKAFKLLNVTVARNDDDTAGTPVLFSADPSKPDATIAFGDISDVIKAGNSVSTVNVAEITSANASVNDNVSDLVISAVIADPVYQTTDALKHATQIIKSGAGTMEFTASNTYTGMVTINEGTLKLSGDAIKTNAPITLGNDGTLEYYLAEGQTKKLEFTNASKIVGTGQIVKTGAGTLQIYTSAVGQVDASHFLVSSGRLDMKDYFKGSMEVKSGATMSPGNSVGTLTIDGAFTLDSGATLLLEVGKDDLGDIIIDQLIVNGNAAFESGSIINIGLDPSSSLVGGDTFSGVILTADNAANIFDDVVNSLQSYYFTDLTPTLSGNQILLSGTLDPNAVPEPSTWSLLILGAAGLLYWRKRK